MPRNPYVPVESPEGVYTRIDIPKGLWTLIGLVSSETGLEPVEVIRLLVRDLDANVVNGKARIFNSLFQPYVAEASQRTRFDQSVKKAEAISFNGQAIDITRLDVNPRLKSGFTGVYGNGQGFRAMGKDPNNGTTIFIGYFRTAIEAAWARCVHHKEHNIPYGPWAALFELERVKNPREPIEWAKKISAWNTGAEGKSSVGIPEEYMTYYEGNYPDINEEIDRAGLTHQDVRSPRSFGDVATATEEAVKVGKAKLAERLAKKAGEKATKLEAPKLEAPKVEVQKTVETLTPLPQPAEDDLPPRDTASDPSPEDMAAINKAAAKRMREIAEQKKAKKRAARVAAQPVELTEEEIIAMSTKG